VISWLPHGRGFVIYKKKAFEEQILPRHFNKQSKFSSFTRKLNRWGFVRVTRGPESGAYYNPYFKRGGHRLCMQMSCQSNSKSSVIKGSAAKTHSDIYPTILTNQATLQQQQQLAQMQQQQQQQQFLQQEMMRRAAMMNQPQSQDFMYMQVMGQPTQQSGAVPIIPAVYQQLAPMNGSSQTMAPGQGLNNNLYSSGGVFPP